MKLIRLTLAAAALLAVSGLAYVAQQARPAGAGMAAAASAFLDTLSDDQKGKAAFPFDSKERFNWNFTPQQDKQRNATRKGLPLEAMSAEQKKAALALVRAGTSDLGADTAVAVMSLEAILRDQEKKGAMVRNPEWYFFTVFGTPSKTGAWGWRVEGHHLSLNFTLEGTQVVAVTPHFYGANPAVTKDGKRVLAPTEALAIELYKSLDDEQRQAAYREKPFPEPEEKSVKPNLGDPVGLPAAKLTEKQRETLKKLIHAYTDRMPPDVAEVELRQIRDNDPAKIHFAFTGSPEQGKGRTYRVQGPTFVIEFLNMQADSAGNPANHIHSAWRRVGGDFGTKKASS